jgi:glycoside/pentoside/hexuronide:cation symporter, GPH family
LEKCTYNTVEHRKIPLPDKIGYGIGNFSAGVAIQVVGAYMVFYCTAVLGIPGSFVGIAVSLSIVWDAITDPLMGYFSDITRSKTFGRRHLYLLIGGLGMAVTNLILWNIGLDLSIQAKFIIILIDLLAIKSFMTIFITPYTALGAELSNDYDERTSIQGIKTIFFLLGLSFVSVVGMYIFFKPTPEFPAGQLNPEAYSNMGLVSSIVIVIFSIVCFIATKKYIPILNQTKFEQNEHIGIVNILASFKEILKNKTFRFVALAYMFNNIASALLSNIGLHVFTYTFLLTSQQIAMIIGAQFLVSMLSQPAWTVISRKLDKKPSFMIGLTICILGSLLFLLLVLFKDVVRGNILYFLPFAMLVGFGTGGLFTLPLSMVADVIDLDELKTGKRSEGSYYGCLTLYYKLSQSITLFLVGFTLDFLKFNSDLPVQAESTVISLGLILAIGPVISFLLSFMSVYKYSLNKEKVESIQQQIAERNKKANFISRV